MISLKSFRHKFNFDLNPQEQSTSVNYLKRNQYLVEIDFDVYLPSIGKNLQREFVWTLDQKRELIFSMLIGRHIPHLAIINAVKDKKYSKDVYQIIDGKQRLSTVFDFLDDKFALVIDNQEYHYSELTEEFRRAVDRYMFRTYMVNEEFFEQIKDYQKINWFKFINFAGTPQDNDHIKGLI